MDGETTCYGLRDWKGFIYIKQLTDQWMNKFLGVTNEQNIGFNGKLRYNAWKDVFHWKVIHVIQLKMYVIRLALNFV